MPSVVARDERYCWSLVATRSPSSRSMVDVNSDFSWSLNSPLAGAANPAWMPLHRPSRPTKIVAGQVFRLTACGTFSHISAGAPAIR